MFVSQNTWKHLHQLCQEDHSKAHKVGLTDIDITCNEIRVSSLSLSYTFKYGGFFPYTFASKLYLH